MNTTIKNLADQKQNCVDQYDFDCVDLDIEKILSDAYIEAGLTVDSMMDFIRSKYAYYNQEEITQELWNSIAHHATNAIMPDAYYQCISTTDYNFCPKNPTWSFLVPPEEIVKKIDFYDLLKNNTDPHGKMVEFVLENITQFIDLTQSEIQIELLRRDRTWEIMCSKYIAEKK